MNAHLSSSSLMMNDEFLEWLDEQVRGFERDLDKYESPSIATTFTALYARRVRDKYLELEQNKHENTTSDR